MQLSVPSTLPIGLAGQLADLQTVSDGDIASVTNTEATASIPFGILCTRDGVEGAKLVSNLATVQNAAGVLVHEHLHSPVDHLADVTVNTNVQSAIKPTVTGSALRRGRIIVIPETGGAETAAVRVRIGGAGQVGCFTAGAAVVGQTVNLGASARWIGAPVAGQPSVVEIDILNFGLATSD